MDPSSDNVDQLELIEQSGPWPFTSRWTYQRPDGSLQVRESRHHRKGLRPAEPSEVISVCARLLQCLWMPRQLNWWIGIVFALGALLFMLASVFALTPALARAWSLDSFGVNAVFFAGSVPFTIAAYLQLFQAANAGVSASPTPRRGMVLFGWQPRDIGWLSSALQFLGTLLFNVNTFDALLPGLDWLQQDLDIWGPDVAGSILFLASGYLAFIETCHAHWAWQPKRLTWWVTFANLLGCVAFMIAAVFAFVPPAAPAFDALTISIAFTLIGALGFLIGSLLMLEEPV
jgi:hypothetical protein